MQEIVFYNYVERLGLPKAGIDYLKLLRHGPDGKGSKPSRNVQNNLGNTTTQYPSKKNKRSRTTESRRVEFAKCLELENDPDVIEYYAQTPIVYLACVKSSGVPANTKFTPDFVALYRDRVEMLDCKMASSMADLVARQPYRYQKVGDDRWQSTPGNNLGKELGFTFRVWTEAELGPARRANFEYLDPTQRLGPDKFTDEDCASLISVIRKHPGISINWLRDLPQTAGTPILNWMIVFGKVYIDLNKYYLGSKVVHARVFPDRATALSMAAIECPEPAWPSPLLSESAPTLSNELSELLNFRKSVTPEVLAEMLRRYDIVTGVVPREKADVCDRTIARYKQAFKAGGFLALRPDEKSRQGNTKRRKPDWVYKLADKVIDRRHLTRGEKSAAGTYAHFVARYTRLARRLRATLKPPSLVWWTDRVSMTPEYQLERAQRGKRAAYSLTPNTHTNDELWQNIGFYPFMRVHCDHTELSIFLRSSTSQQPLQKPWLTILFDAFSRSVLAKYLTFHRPTKASIMMVLRDCVARHRRVPFGMCMDNGPEFHSNYFRALAAAHEIILRPRPPVEPRYGAPLENHFGIVERQLITELEGCSHIFKTPRISSKEVDPRRHATWTIECLDALLEWYLFDYFNEKVHKDHGKKRSSALIDGLKEHGLQDLQLVKSEEEFYIASLPEIRKTKATVFKPGTVKFLNDTFEHPDLSLYLRDRLVTRYDPLDVGYVMVETPKGWLKCISKFAAEQRGLTPKQRAFYAEEVRARHAATDRDNDGITLQFGTKMIEVVGKLEPQMKKDAEEAAKPTPAPKVPKPTIKPAKDLIIPKFTPRAKAESL